MTSMRDQGRSCDSVLDTASSDAGLAPTTSPVVITRFALQASPMVEAAWASPPGDATMTTRSAVPASVVKSLGWPEKSRAAPGKAAALRNVALCHGRPASRLTMASLAVSRAMTLIARGREFGSWIRNRASARELIRADSLCMEILRPKQAPRRDERQTRLSRLL